MVDRFNKISFLLTDINSTKPNRNYEIYNIKYMEARAIRHKERPLSQDSRVKDCQLRSISENYLENLFYCYNNKVFRTNSIDLFFQKCELTNSKVNRFYGENKIFKYIFYFFMHLSQKGKGK